jgi:hypothetical protein
VHCRIKKLESSNDFLLARGAAAVWLFAIKEFQASLDHLWGNLNFVGFVRRPVTTLIYIWSMVCQADNSPHSAIKSQLDWAMLTAVAMRVSFGTKSCIAASTRRPPGIRTTTTLYVLCPPTVTDQSRKKTYTRPFTYTIELATHCNAAVNLAIGEALERLDLFNPAQHIVSETDTVAAILSSPEIPDWAKATSPLAFGQMDYPVAAAEIAESRIKQMRSLLGQQQGEITPAASA